MSQFISNLLKRHTSTSHLAKPRARSRFESVQPFIETSAIEGNNEFNTKEERRNTPFIPSELPTENRQFEPQTAFSTTINTAKESSKRQTVSPITSPIKARVIDKTISMPSRQTLGHIISPKQKAKPIIPNLEQGKSSIQEVSKPPIAFQKEQTKLTVEPQALAIQNKKVVYPQLEQQNQARTKRRQVVFPQISERERQAIMPPLQTIAPTIKITIGSIEVRAIQPTKQNLPKKKRTTPKPTLSLSDYLKKRN